VTLRDDILAQASARRGLVYQLEPPPDGVTTTDCSLLVRESVRAAGAGELPRTAEQQRQATVPIPWQQAQPGDLVFFADTYDAAGPAGPDGRIASHVGFSLGAGTQRMLDAHERDGDDVAITDISTPYWQQHFLEVRRLPSLVEQQDTGGDPEGLTDEADHLFGFEELWPTIKAAGAEFGFDTQVLAGIIEQESGFRNWRVHFDGTGHGLLGLDDNGLLPDFERWSGLSIGRGQAARSIPIVPQVRYAASALADYARRLGGPYAAARAWHRGERLMDDTLGRHYEELIRAHVAELFSAGEPAIAEPEPEPQPAPERFSYVLGFADLAARLGADVVGDPLEPEHTTSRNGHVVNHQLTTRGELVYWLEANRADFYPAA
jgi:hypothetical protein